MKKNLKKIIASGDNAVVIILRFVLFLCTPPGMHMVSRSLIKKLKARGVIHTQKNKYSAWIDEEDRKRSVDNRLPDDSNIEFTVVVFPVDMPAADLSATIASIQTQTYRRWKTIFFGFQQSEECKLLVELATEAPAKFSFKTDWNGVNGTHLVFLPAGDVLAADALATIANFILSQSAGGQDTGLIYFDEDFLLADGKRTPYFKPAFSPDSLLSRNYVGECFCVSMNLFHQLGGLGGMPQRESLYELLLRAAESVTFDHIPAVLVHRNDAIFFQSDALTEAARLRRIQPAATNTASNALVSILIPTRDQTILLSQALESIFTRTDYPYFEVLVLDNNSSDPTFFELCKAFRGRFGDRFRVLPAEYDFNFSRLMNQGAAAARGEFLLMLNNDVEVLNPDWMARMVGFGRLQHIGAVGAKLLYPDGTIQHAGIALGGETATQHLFAHEPKNAMVHFNYLNYNNNVAAVTAACLLCRKEVFLKVGGMDETLSIEYNDVDLCLRFLRVGLFNVWLHDVVLLHHESASRGHPFRSLASWRKHREHYGHFVHTWEKSGLLKDRYWDSRNDLVFE